MKEIFCTLGPASFNQKFLKGIKNKVNLLRINLSHTNINDLEKLVTKVRKYSNIPICIDTEGAQIRTKIYKKIKLNKNQKVLIDGNYKSKNLTFYPDVYEQLRVGDVISIGFDNLVLKIIRKKKNYFISKVTSAGLLENNKGTHIINRKIYLEPLTKKDLSAIEKSLELNINNYALSFTNSEKDISLFKSLLPNKRTIFKIETFSAIKNIDKIFKNCDEILIDRGDLSKDIKLERVPFFQREIQRKAKKKNKKVYIATNLLEAMVKDPNPTRAEINDIYNCLELGADGLVLAAETAIGKWPLKSVRTIHQVIKEFNKNNKK